MLQTEVFEGIRVLIQELYEGWARRGKRFRMKKRQVRKFWKGCLTRKPLQQQRGFIGGVVERNIQSGKRGSDGLEER